MSELRFPTLGAAIAHHLGLALIDVRAVEVTEEPMVSPRVRIDFDLSPDQLARLLRGIAEPGDE